MTTLNATNSNNSVKPAKNLAKKGYEVRYVLGLIKSESDQNIFRVHTSMMKGFKRREIVALENTRTKVVVFGPIMGCGLDYKLRSNKALCTSYDHRRELEVEDGDLLLIRKPTSFEQLMLNWKTSGHTFPAYMMGAGGLAWAILSSVFGG